MRPTIHAFPFTVLYTAAVLLAAGSAHAAAEAGAEPDGPSWSFAGFGSVGAVHSDYDQADYTSTILKGDGAGATRAVSYTLDSRLGAQLDARFDKQWSAVVQLGVEQRFDGSYRPQVEWANIKYQATPDLALRAGRIALPIFLAADYRKIGYAYPWARTPNEVYGGVPITNSDGADIAYRWKAGRVKHTTQAFYGRTNVHLTDSTGVEARGLGGLTHTAEWGPATVRVSAFTAVLDVNIVRQLFDTYRQFGPAGVAIADKFDVIDKRTTGFALGVNIDPGKWFLMAEGGRMNTNSFLGDSVGMYASAGYRSGEFTPYVSYARNKLLSASSDPGLSLAGLPPQLAAVAAQLNGGLNVLLKASSSQTNLAAGVRWDFRPDMALKLQYERVTPRDGTRGTLVNLEPGFVSGHPVNVTSAVLDFVF
jgi:hypothetical protein